MKTILRGLVGIFLVVGFFLITSSSADAYVNVRGYTRKDGTYVAPHVRSNPNGLKSDNYGYKPSQGVYNKTYGTRGVEWDTPTYITDPDYYEGKALYESGNSSSSYSLPTYKATLPIRNVSYVTKTWADSNPTVACSKSTFLRARERLECETYKSKINSYTWNVTTNEFDGMHYIYNEETKVASSCGDGYTVLYDSKTGKVTSKCTPELSATLPTCAPGLKWNGTMCIY